MTSVFQFFGIGQEGLSNHKFFRALEDRHSFEKRTRKLSGANTTPIPATVIQQVFSEDTYSLTSTFLTLIRSVAYTAHKLFRELSDKTQVRLELTKVFALITLPLSALNLKDEWSKEHSMNKLLHMGVQVSNSIEAAGMVLEAVYAAGKYTGRIVFIADLCSGVSTIGGSILFYSLDVIALIKQRSLEKNLDTLTADTTYKDAFRKRLHTLNHTRYASIVATTLNAVAYALFTQGTPYMIGYGWICMSAGAMLMIGAKVYQARAINQFMIATQPIGRAANCTVS